MLRISEVETGNGHVVLKLEGRIVGPWVSELGNACTGLLQEPRKLTVDLSGVSYVDRPGVALLQDLKRRKVLLEGCSPFVTEELRGTGPESPSSKVQAPSAFVESISPDEEKIRNQFQTRKPPQ